MEPIQYLRALRQWWWVIAASTLIGIVIAVVVQPANQTQYRATHDLIYAPSVTADGDASADDTESAVDRFAFIATRGEVLRRVSEAVGEPDLAALQRRIHADGNGELRTLSITATGTDARDTETLADTVAAELDAQLDEQATADQATGVATLQAQVNDLERQIASLLPGTDEREALSTQYTDALERLRQLRSEGTPTSGLSTVQGAAAVVTSTGTSDLARFAIAGFVGFLIGVGLALVLTRFDTRIHSKEEAEQAFGLPVIAEIPMLSRAARQRHDVVSLSTPESPGAEAYRSLRTALVVAPRVRWSLPEGASRTNRGLPIDTDKPDPPPSQVVLVISPGPGEGKSTTVANLAVAFAETGKYVLVLSGDLRRPMVDRYLSVADDSPGMSELLSGQDGLQFVDVVRATSIPNVRIVPSGHTVSNPGELLSHHGMELINQARSVADIVIIDSPPVLATNDTSPLLPYIDEVLVVCRAGTTTAAAARRVSELLTRLGASASGVALVGVMSLPTVRGYYRAYGTTRPPVNSSRRERDTKPDGKPAGGAVEANGPTRAGRRVQPSDSP